MNEDAIYFAASATFQTVLLSRDLRGGNNSRSKRRVDDRLDRGVCARHGHELIDVSMSGGPLQQPHFSAAGSSPIARAQGELATTYAILGLL